MSKTPLTDAVWERFRTDTSGELEPDVEFSTLARTLECKLNTANNKIEQLVNFAQNIANNYDHDADAHRYITPCRVCEAERLLISIQ